MTEKRLIAGQAAGMLLALGVGILIGARACTPEPAEPTEMAPEVRERVIYRCPDAATPSRLAADAGPDAPEDVPVEAEPEVTEPSRPTRNSDSDRALPAAPEPQTPAERRQLLAWVREQSTDLRGCGGSNPRTIRTTVTLELKDDGTVRRVFLVDSTNDIPATTERCLRSRMSEWVPPTELVASRDRLIFGLTL